MHTTVRKIALALAASSVFCAAASAQAVTGREILFDPQNPSVEIMPSQYPALVEKAVAARNFRRAMYVIDVGLKKNPRSAQLKFQRCNVLEAMGQTDEARECYKDFIAHYPEISEPYNNLAKIESARGDLEEAENLLKQAVAVNPKFAVAWENLGNLYLARAKTSFERAAAVGGKSVADRALAVDVVMHGESEGQTEKNSAR